MVELYEEHQIYMLQSSTSDKWDAVVDGIVVSSGHKTTEEAREAAIRWADNNVIDKQLRCAECKQPVGSKHLSTCSCAKENK